LIAPKITHFDFSPSRPNFVRLSNSYYINVPTVEAMAWSLTEVALSLNKTLTRREKKLIALTVHWIEAEKLTQSILTDMPEPRMRFLLSTLNENTNLKFSITKPIPWTQ
jgi:hypothetical protein